MDRGSNTGQGRSRWRPGRNRAGAQDAACLARRVARKPVCHAARPPSGWPGPSAAGSSAASPSGETRRRKVPGVPPRISSGSRRRGRLRLLRRKIIAAVGNHFSMEEVGKASGLLIDEWAQPRPRSSGRSFPARLHRHRSRRGIMACQGAVSVLCAGTQWRRAVCIRLAPRQVGGCSRRAGARAHRRRRGVGAVSRAGSEGL